MTTVFLSGSRRIGRLNETVRRRVDNIIGQRLRVVVGDANGADKAFQQYLAAKGYQNVVVYCSGNRCRNNAGNWPTENVPVAPELKGRDFYIVKDKAMAREADYGFILWDGASVGAFENLVELVRQTKTVLLYLSPDKTFHRIHTMDQVIALLESRPREVISEISRKVRMDALDSPGTHSVPQLSLSFDE